MVSLPVPPSTVERDLRRRVSRWCSAGRSRCRRPVLIRNPVAARAMTSSRRPQSEAYPLQPERCSTVIPLVQRRRCSGCRHSRTRTDVDVVGLAGVAVYDRRRVPDSLLERPCLCGLRHPQQSDRADEQRKNAGEPPASEDLEHLCLPLQQLVPPRCRRLYGRVHSAWEKLSRTSVEGACAALQRGASALRSVRGRGHRCVGFVSPKTGGIGCPGGRGPPCGGGPCRPAAQLPSRLAGNWRDRATRRRSPRRAAGPGGA